MSLEDELKELQEQLKAAEDAENETPQEEKPKEQAPEDRPPPADTPETDAPAGDEKKDDDEPKDASAYARMRREAAQAKREADEAKAEAAALKAQLSQPKAQEQPQAQQPNAAPDPKEDYTGWLEHQIADIQGQLSQRNQLEQADYMVRGSLAVIEADAEKIRSERPDLDDAREFAVKELKKSYRLAGIPANQIDYQVNLRLIQEAAEGKKSGQNTASYLYDWAVSDLGYNPKEIKETEAPKARDLKPDMSKVAANRQRNAGTMSPSGNGGGNALDAETLSNMKPSELQKIPLEERNRIYREAGFIS